MFLATQLKAIHTRFTLWSEEFKIPQVVKPLPVHLWRMVLVFGLLLLIVSLKVWFDEYSLIIAKLMERYSIENNATLFSWLYSDTLCLILWEIFVLCIWGVISPIREYWCDYSWENNSPDILQLLPVFPLMFVIVELSNALTRLTLSNDAPEIMLWLILIDRVVKISGPCLMIMWAKFHINKNEDEDKERVDSETA
jgi:hypothetical protein